MHNGDNKELVDDDALSETDADIGEVSFIRVDGSSVDRRHRVSNELDYLEKASEANFASTSVDFSEFLKISLDAKRVLFHRDHIFEVQPFLH